MIFIQNRPLLHYFTTDIHDITLMYIIINMLYYLKVYIEKEFNILELYEKR